jgi:hypothetical protein
VAAPTAPSVSEPTAEMVLGGVAAMRAPRDPTLSVVADRPQFWKDQYPVSAQSPLPAGQPPIGAGVPSTVSAPLGMNPFAASPRAATPTPMSLTPPEPVAPLLLPEERVAAVPTLQLDTPYRPRRERPSTGSQRYSHPLHEIATRGSARRRRATFLRALATAVALAAALSVARRLWHTYEPRLLDAAAQHGR